MTAIKGVIFDLYSTLVHFERQPEFFNNLLKDLSLDKQKDKRTLNMYMTRVYNTYDEYLKMIAPDLEISTEKYEAFIKQEVASAQLYPETIKTLQELVSKGIKIGLISNCGAPYKQPFYNLGLDKYIKEPVFSCDTGFIKPQPQIYAKALIVLDLEPGEVIMTGDSMNADVIGPQRMGINAIHLDRKGISGIPSLKGILKYV